MGLLLCQRSLRDMIKTKSEACIQRPGGPLLIDEKPQIVLMTRYRFAVCHDDTR